MASGLLAAARGLGRPEPLPLAGALPQRRRTGGRRRSDAAQPAGATTAVPKRSAVVDLRDDDLDLEPPDWVSSAEPAARVPPPAPRDDASPPYDRQRRRRRRSSIGPRPRPRSRRPSGGRMARRARPAPLSSRLPAGAGLPNDERTSGAAPGRTARVGARRTATVAVGGRRSPIDPAGVCSEAPPGRSLLDRHSSSDRRARRTPCLTSAPRLGRGGAPSSGPRSAGRSRPSTVAVTARQPGQIIGTEPAAGDKLKRGGTLVASSSPTATRWRTSRRDLAGKPAADVQAQLEKLGLVPKTTHAIRRDRLPKDAVIGLAAGTPARLPKEQTVGLVVSDGPEAADRAERPRRRHPRRRPEPGWPASSSRRTRPALQRDRSEGQDHLDPTGRRSECARDSTVDAGGVQRAEAAGRAVGLVGGSEASARAKLSGMQLVVTSTAGSATPSRPGRSSRPCPASGTTPAPAARTVALVVSKGPDLVTVPSLSGVTSIDGAIAVLRNAGLTAGNVSGPAAGRPVSTSPVAGQRVKRGSSVDIRLG